MANTTTLKVRMIGRALARRLAAEFPNETFELRAVDDDTVAVVVREWAGTMTLEVDNLSGIDPVVSTLRLLAARRPRVS